MSARPGRARPHAYARLRLPASVQSERAPGYMREPQAAYVTSLPAARQSGLLSLPAIALPFTGMSCAARFPGLLCTNLKQLSASFAGSLSALCSVFKFKFPAVQVGQPLALVSQW